jgi:hypothetical protein
LDDLIVLSEDVEDFLFGDNFFLEDDVFLASSNVAVGLILEKSL